LALRNQTNLAFFATKGVDTSQLLNKSPAPEVVATLPSSERPRTGPTTQLIKGMTVSQVEF